MTEGNETTRPYRSAGMGTENEEVDFAFRTVDERVVPTSTSREGIEVDGIDTMAVGSCRIVPHGARSIGLYRLSDGYYAVLNFCPHQGADICAGKVGGTHRPSSPQEFVPCHPDRILRCPWHGWEFDVVTGKGLHDHKSHLRTYAVEILSSKKAKILV